MKGKKNKKLKTDFVTEHKKIMSSFKFGKSNNQFYNIQWQGANDAFTKFSLYSETPNSISSTDSLTSSFI
jgi:hypothetical protein